ncbi:MAG: hypothetical protein EZS28_014727 [Streblomastix strix]|uniref:Uncharacterized protein n=1 Tax=Streblomastix strix TaxID=222440 RepID=A0A5J4W4I2_9EUKA|nr:MAG: hypothetical protein EZS28_014727 [Streblomastix strix]
MQGDTFSKVDEILFSFFFPLYEQRKKQNELWHIFMIVWQIVQMTAMSLYSVDIQTNQVSRVASIVGYLDGSQLSLIIGKYLPYVNIGIFVLEIAMIGMMFAACLLYRYIIASQPWNNILQIVSAVIAIINLIVFFIMSIILNIAIYNHNPKNGGLLSCPNGVFASLQNILLFGNIFIVRMLYGWPFWRGVVNVGVSILVRTTTQSLKLIQLLPTDDSESRGERGTQKEMVLIPSMMTGDPKKHNYRTHAREHLIIRQRLTILGDQLHVETDGGASKMIARRNTIRLYDVHFSNADLAYATIIPGSEKTQVGGVNDTIS